MLLLISRGYYFVRIYSWPAEESSIEPFSALFLLLNGGLNRDEPSSMEGRSTFNVGQYDVQVRKAFNENLARGVRYLPSPLHGPSLASNSKLPIITYSHIVALRIEIVDFWPNETDGNCFLYGLSSSCLYRGVTSHILHLRCVYILSTLEQFLKSSFVLPRSG